MSGQTAAMLRLDDLPKTIPVFPLTGALLLPEGRLPLNIFEPRYLAMIDDALSARDRLIGMVQPREPGTEGMTRGGVVPPPSTLYTTGCAGRISSFNETGDGRYLITLTGVCRFDIVEELPTVRGYRRVVPDFGRWDIDLSPGTSERVDRNRLMGPLRSFFSAHNISTDWDAVAATPDERLITTLAMSCPFAPQEKQALLECRTLAERADVLATLVDIAAAGPGGETAKH
jgi:uncharacterized protein